MSTNPEKRQPPPGMFSVPVGKGCVLLLTTQEYARALRRGKTWRRAVERRERSHAQQA